MVPASHRMRRAEDFAAAVRRGRRSGSSTVVAHFALVGGEAPVRVGFVVNKAVGGAVIRNTVRRRLRHLLRDRLDQLSAGSLLVIRALPASAVASSAQLAGDVDAVLTSVLRPGRRAPGKSTV